MRALQFTAGILLLLVPEILRVYFIMPFPGSQEWVPTDDSQVNIAYFLHGNIWWIRALGILLLAAPLIHYLRNKGWLGRIGVLLPVALCAVVYYAFNFKFMADKMFYPPKEKMMVAAESSSAVRSSLVISVVQNGDARAYPIELIGYHHQVSDTIGGEPVLVTYCTVCRTGRAYSPKVDGALETFRLVGMDHFNAMFEDSRTGSWWRQVSGECIAGPRKGQKLEEVPSVQMTLQEFAERYPRGLVFQPDRNFAAQYAGLEGYDDGTIPSSLEYRDTASWQPKSWVVGVVHNGQTRAYDWNELNKARMVIDTIGGDSIQLTVEQAGFEVNHRWTEELPQPPTACMDTAASWVASVNLERIPAYQEFWHSWRTFHPNTTRYVKP